MPGYIGTKAVLLSTTAANVAGNAEITGDLTVDTSTLFVNSTNNRVGVGTTSASTELHVKGSGDYAALTLEATTSGGASYVNLGDSADIDVGQLAYFNSDNSMRFTTNASERMRIDSSGNMLMGNSTTPSAASANAPILLVSGPNDASIQLSRENATAGGGLIQSAAGPGLLFYTHTGAVGSESYSERMRIDSSGNLLVGTTSNPDGNRLNVVQTVSGATSGFQVYANGSGAINWYNATSGYVASVIVNASSVAYNTTSDYRLKEDVQPMVGASDRLMALKPVNFAWKADGTRVDGFLAHEAQAVVPEAITGEKDAVDDDGNPKYQGIDQSKLVPLLTAALQEALTEISDLKARVAALEAV